MGSSTKIGQTPPDLNDSAAGAAGPSASAPGSPPPSQNPAPGESAVDKSLLHQRSSQILAQRLQIQELMTEIVDEIKTKEIQLKNVRSSGRSAQEAEEDLERWMLGNMAKQLEAGEGRKKQMALEGLLKIDEEIGELCEGVVDVGVDLRGLRECKSWGREI